MAEVLQGAGWQTDEVLEYMKGADDFYFEHIGLVKLDAWSRGRVTLVGDAAYCPSASTGMGTTSGIVGAYILAGEIGRHCGCSDGENADGGGIDAKEAVLVALEAYERKFRPFMEQVQKGVGEGSGWGDMLLSTSLGIGVLHCFLGVVSLLGVNIGKWMLQEDIKGWDLPEYEEMLRK